MIAFSGPKLDRAPNERRRGEWLEARRTDTRASTVLIGDEGVWIEGGRLVLAPPDGATEIFLGLADGRPLFAADTADAAPPRGRAAGLREATVELPSAEAALAAYAASLLSWHRRHRFCANCGAPTSVADAGHERRCPSCETHHFPRTDPVVIVRVVDAAGRLLLGRQPSWDASRYSLLAGFVEPGETLEDAVRREVHEESGIEVGSVAYVASQPWPFPSSLMLGFQAVAERGEPVADGEELADVRFFERAQVAAAAAGSGPLALSPPPSIARRLIDAWLAEVSPTDVPSHRPTRGCREGHGVPRSGRPG